MAATKYLLVDMIDDLNGYVKHSLNVSNACIVYDQMLAFKAKLNGPIEESRLRCITIIKANAEEAIKADTFTAINQQTLISILNFDYLRISEFELLKACLRWTDAELKRRDLKVTAANRRTIFESIQGLIAFRVLSLEELGQVEIESFLSTEHVASIFLNLSNPSKSSSVAYSAKRTPFQLYSVGPKGELALLGFTSDSQMVRFVLKVNKAAFVESISVLPIRNVRSVTLEIGRDNQRLISRSKVCGYEQSARVQLDRLQLLANVSYKVDFTFLAVRETCRHCGSSASTVTVSQEQTLKSENGEFVFNFSKISGNFCVQKINFYPASFDLS